MTSKLLKSNYNGSPNENYSPKLLAAAITGVILVLFVILMILPTQQRDRGMGEPMSFKNTPSADKLNGLADDLNNIARDGLDPLSVVALDEAEIVLRDYAELSLLAEHTVKAFLRFTAERPDA